MKKCEAYGEVSSKFGPGFFWPYMYEAAMPIATAAAPAMMYFWFVVILFICK